jgi:hypothetical protein
VLSTVCFMMIVVSVSCNVPAQVATSSIHTTGHFLHFACVSKRHNFALLFDHSLHIFFAYDELTVFNPSPLHTFSRASVAPLNIICMINHVIVLDKCSYICKITSRLQLVRRVAK